MSVADLVEGSIKKYIMIPCTRVRYNSPINRYTKYLSVFEYFRFFDHPIIDLAVSVMATREKIELVIMCNMIRNWYINKVKNYFNARKKCSNHSEMPTFIKTASWFKTKAIF